ncbi:serine/threonine-protein kinase [Actinocorallia longicatena]|uniref:Protein kinase domain-containing protein n=1 Tax=Actinocorallia longicatena TaxID=111803 RepID=A0ABP6QNS7_9ACTN
MARATNVATEPLGTGDPEQIGGYRLLGRLGVGGMGVVYLAETEAGPVAVKTLRRADAVDPMFRARFRAEASHAGQIGSAHTARLIEDGSDASTPYLVTEYLDGPPLAAVVHEDEPLPSDALYAVAIGVADALAAIHAAGIIHRDVKPSNVLLTPGGPRVIDFGIARTLDGADGMTQTGLVVGSPGWVAPERLTGSPATPATDVYGWGLLVAYAGTGRHPFGPGTPSELTEHVLTRRPDLQGLGEPLHSLAAAALSRTPAERPRSDELRQALMAPRSEPTAALAVDHLWTTVRDVTAIASTWALPAVVPVPGRRIAPTAAWLAAILLASGAAAAGVFFLAGQDDAPPLKPDSIITTITEKAKSESPKTRNTTRVPQQTVPVPSDSATPKPTTTPSPTLSATPSKTASEAPEPDTETPAGDDAGKPTEKADAPVASENEKENQ